MSYVVTEIWKQGNQIMLKTACNKTDSLVTWAAILKINRGDLYNAYIRNKDKLPSSKILEDDRKFKKDYTFCPGYRLEHPGRLIAKEDVYNEEGRKEPIYKGANGVWYTAQQLATVSEITLTSFRNRRGKHGWDHEHLLVVGKQFGKRIDGSKTNRCQRKSGGVNAGSKEWRSLSDKVSSCKPLPSIGSVEAGMYCPAAASGGVQDFL